MKQNIHHDIQNVIYTIILLIQQINCYKMKFNKLKIFQFFDEMKKVHSK